MRHSPNILIGTINTFPGTSLAKKINWLKKQVKFSFSAMPSRNFPGLAFLLINNSRPRPANKCFLATVILCDCTWTLIQLTCYKNSLPVEVNTDKSNNLPYNCTENRFVLMGYRDRVLTYFINSQHLRVKNSPKGLPSGRISTPIKKMVAIDICGKIPVKIIIYEIIYETELKHMLPFYIFCLFIYSFYFLIISLHFYVCNVWFVWANKWILKFIYLFIYFFICLFIYLSILFIYLFLFWCL